MFEEGLRSSVENQCPKCASKEPQSVENVYRLCEQSVACGSVGLRTCENPVRSL